MAADFLVEEVRLYLEGWNDGCVGQSFGVLGALRVGRCSFSVPGLYVPGYLEGGYSSPVGTNLYGFS